MNPEPLTAPILRRTRKLVSFASNAHEVVIVSGVVESFVLDLL
jgi:hypothetical protein